MVTRGFPGGPVAKTLSSHAGGPDSTPGQEARSHMLQLKILYVAAKTWSSSQIHKYIFLNKRV